MLSRRDLFSRFLRGLGAISVINFGAVASALAGSRPRLRVGAALQAPVSWAEDCSFVVGVRSSLQNSDDPMSPNNVRTALCPLCNSYVHITATEATRVQSPIA